MPCKPIAICSALLLSPTKKKKKKSPSKKTLKQKQTHPQKKQEKAFLDVVVQPEPRHQNHHHHHTHHHHGHSSGDQRRPEDPRSGKALRRSSSEAHREFLRATSASSAAAEGKLTSPLSLPPCESAYAQFMAAYPRFAETRVLDQLREREYGHLEEDESVCLDYCGFGLFCDDQSEELLEEDGIATTNPAATTTTNMFLLTEVSANLWSHALFGSAPEGTMEWGIRSRIMEYLSIPESEYSLVFTVSRGASFKLLADAYPWASSPRLVTMYDYESESVGWMEQRAAEKGAKLFRAKFRWPSLRVCSAELKRELLISAGGDAGTKKGRSAKSWLDRVSHLHQPDKKTKKKGLFVFPVQSRVSGAKYSYQWMSIAQQNQWHVMLDASALGPKDMDSLALSLFRPDFITASFYRLFGGDPSGFGCLLIKNSVAQSIQDPSGAQVSGMVRITPFYGFSGAASSTSMDSEALDAGHMVSSFSGPVPAFEDLEMPPPLHHLPACLENSGCEEDEDLYTSACDDPDADGVSRSSVFSEDGASENPFFRNVGSAKIPSVSGEEAPQDPAKGSLVSSSSGQISGKRDSRIRIKEICSGLLHLHTRRVGDNGEDQDVSLKDGGGKVFPEEEEEEADEDQEGLKHMESQQKSDCLDATTGKHVPTTDVPLSDLQSIRYELGSKEDERLVLVLKKVEGQHAPVDDGNTTLGLRYKEQDHEDESAANGTRTMEEIGREIEEVRGVGNVDKTNPGENSLLQDRASGMLPSNLKGNAISRETEGGFRLLGRRNSDRFSLSRILSSVPGNESSHSRSAYLGVHEDVSFGRSSEMKSYDDEEEQIGEETMEEPQLLCRSLDHADMLGLNRTSFRLRYLINWLISSLLRLKHPVNDTSLVRIYGPQVRYDRGASVAFNIFDSQGKLLHPEHVRMLADQLNIFLGLGFLRNVYFRGNLIETPIPGYLNTQASQPASKPVNVPSRVEVVTAALGLLSDFKDVYRLWAFVARFLDPDYVTTELNHLHATSREPLEEKNSNEEAVPTTEVC